MIRVHRHCSESCSAVNKKENIRCDWRFKDSLLWLHRSAQVVGPSSLFTSTLSDYGIKCFRLKSVKMLYVPVNSYGHDGAVSSPNRLTRR